ncbi:MAG TPA: DUF1080 domain-containing protein [Saprospiraceae bacterium]|nr:DUF1080 domain-containing protein [Saprospiraceae bacterium]
MRFSHFAWLLLALALWGCKKETATVERPHDPWVFRSVLDSLPRMLTVALHDDVWAAYSAQTGALYKVWKGGVNFDGAVYTTAHGPQPSTLGDAYFHNDYPEPWTVALNGTDETPRIQYRGHSFDKKGKVSINTELILSNGAVVKVHERPEYITNTTGQPGMERVFETEGLPSGAQLKFMFNLSSIAHSTNIETDGTLTLGETTTRQVDDREVMDLNAVLTLQPKGKTRLAAYFTKPSVPNPNKIVGAEEEEEVPLGFRLIARSDCKTCHNTYVKTIGPSYVDIAKKYMNTPENTAMLVQKVKLGGAGVWGEAAMSAHPDASDADLTTMVSYIMALDSVEEAAFVQQHRNSGPVTNARAADKTIGEDNLLPGALTTVWTSKKTLTKLSDVDRGAEPVFVGIMPEVKMGSGDFGPLTDNFAVRVEGYLRIPKTSNYLFRLKSDDGSQLFIGNKLIIDHDGLHGDAPKDGEVALEEGFHPFRIDFFQGGGGKALFFEWSSFDSNGEFGTVPAMAFFHDKNKQPTGTVNAGLSGGPTIPGDGSPVTAVHPAFDLRQARPAAFLPKVGGMDFLSDGRLVVSTWDAEGGVYILDGALGDDPEKIKVKKIAKGLAEPLGLKVVDDVIYILQKQELTKLIDHNGDDIIDEYYTLCNDWKVSANFHEFSFGLAYKDGWFYGALAIAILPGGASANPQIPDRGKAIRVNKDSGKMEIVAEGLRTPNGVGIGADGEVFIADNQGDWLPSSKILHVSKGAFFGSRAVDSARVAQLPLKLPVVWLPQDEIGNSPSTPLYLDKGPYKGQMIHGEVTHGGVKRVFVEKVGGEYQGVVFRFIQGLEAGVNRMVWGPDGALYVGGIGNPGNWQHYGTQWYGLQRLQYNNKPVFEMLAVRARSNGVEIEFTAPLEDGLGWDPAAYNVQQWYYLPTKEYGGPKLDQKRLAVKSAHVSQDRRKVFLELEGMKENHVVYIRLPYWWTGDGDLELWSTEAWYTMNRIPQNQPGFQRTAPAPTPVNTLSDAERKAGWKLLFDGQSLKGWRNYGKKTIGSSWKIDDGAIHLAAKKNPNGGWQAPDGGDIITDGEYENYELRLEWKIGACGNSGIIYNVEESDKYQYPWQTGPEMQVLDNACHPDSKIRTHRAGDLYDLIECKYETVKPAGEWNRVRLVVNKGKVQHWLNGRKVVETEMWTDEWRKMVAASKFKDMPGFGTVRKGHLCLQDHGDPVWYRNVKIKEL